jgi:hypothetical protein
VSAGASNKDAEKFNQNNSHITTNSQGQNTSTSYDKLIGSEASGTTQGSGMANDQTVSSPAGGALPNGSIGGSDSPRGGINTSNSTVSGASSSAGAVAGMGSHHDRGAMTDTGADATTNTEDSLDLGSQQ